MAELAGVLLRAAAITGAAVALGGGLLVLAILRPWLLRDPDARPLCVRALALSAAGAATAVAHGALLATWVGPLAGAWDLSVGDVLATQPGRLAVARAGVAVLCAGLFLLARRRLPALGPVVAATAVALALVASTAATSHAAAVLHGRLGLMALDAVHQVAMAAWLGGLVHLAALTAAWRGRPWPRMALARFSLLAAAAVATLALSGAGLAGRFIATPSAAIGSSYGGMALAKLALLGAILMIAAGNSRVARRWPRGGGRPPAAFRRMLQVETGLVATLVLVAVSLASAPPAVDVVGDDRATLGEVVARLTPHWPTLTSPTHAELVATADLRDPLADRTATEILWSEYNHNVSGLFVLVMGLLAVASRSARWPWTRHWPLLYLGLAAFIVARSDPEAPLLAASGLWTSLADPEVFQHRVLGLLPAALGVVEWGTTTGRLTGPWRDTGAILAMVGGALLLAHGHSLVHVKEAYLMEVTHIPLGLLGIAVGWGRWLETRLPAPGREAAGWVWRIALVLVGLLLLGYHEH